MLSEEFKKTALGHLEKMSASDFVNSFKRIGSKKSDKDNFNEITSVFLKDLEIQSLLNK